MTFAFISDDLYCEYVDGKGLSGVAFAVHVAAILKCVSYRNDGIMVDRNVTAIFTQLGFRGKARTVAELIDCGLWEDLGDGRYQIDWTHQKTADQVARDKERANLRQADFRERDSRCKAGDHTLCEGTKRRCQTPPRNAVSNAELSRTSPVQSSPFHSSPIRKDKDLDMDKDLDYEGIKDTPTTDQPGLGFAHHPPSSDPASGRPSSSEDALWSASAGEGGDSTQLFERASTALDMQATRKVLTVKLVKPAWDAWLALDDADPALRRTLLAAEKLTEFASRDVEDFFESTNHFRDEGWPVRMKLESDAEFNGDQMLTWVNARMPLYIEALASRSDTDGEE